MHGRPRQGRDYRAGTVTVGSEPTAIHGFPLRGKRARRLDNLLNLAPMGRRGTSLPSLCPQFGGFQHHIGVYRKIVQDGLEAIKPVDAFLEARTDKLAAHFVIRDLRDVNNRAFPEETLKPFCDLAVGAGMGNLAQGAGVKDNSACHSQSLNLLR